MTKSFVSVATTLFLTIPLFGLQSEEWFKDFMTTYEAAILVVYTDYPEFGSPDCTLDGLNGCSTGGAKLGVLGEPYASDTYLYDDTDVIRFLEFTSPIPSIPEEIVYLKRLDTFYYALDSNLSTLPGTLSEMTSLVYFYMMNAQFEEIPESLSHVNHLYFYNNKIKSIPDWVYEDHDAATLSIVKNRVSHLDRKICDSNITRLGVSKNYLRELPVCMKEMNLSTMGTYMHEFLFGSDGGYVDSLNIATNPYLSGFRVCNDDPEKPESNEECITNAGWTFYDLQIGYEYMEDNATISFTPWLGDFYEVKSYAWDFGDGELSDEESPMHLFPSYGDYNVSLVLTLEDNSTLESSKIVSYQEKALQITKGWNLLGVPTKDDIQTDSFPDSFTFFTYAEGQWSVNPAVIEPMQGFWVKADSNLSYAYGGEPYELQSYVITEGWNLLSSGEKTELNQFSDISITWVYKDGIWIKNPTSIGIGEGVWILK